MRATFLAWKTSQPVSDKRCRFKEYFSCELRVRHQIEAIVEPNRNAVARVQTSRNDDYSSAWRAMHWETKPNGHRRAIQG
jgi:hypothetical protein